jgi:hypothetical protein
MEFCREKEESKMMHANSQQAPTFSTLSRRIPSNLSNQIQSSSISNLKKVPPKLSSVIDELPIPSTTINQSILTSIYFYKQQYHQYNDDSSDFYSDVFSFQSISLFFNTDFSQLLSAEMVWLIMKGTYYEVIA